MDTASLVSGVSGLTKKGKKRPRKSKGKDDESVVGGKAKSVVSGNSGVAGRAGKRQKRKADEEEEEEDEGPGMELQVVERSKQEEEKEKQQRSMLVQAFNSEQQARYGMWRAVKLPDQKVRQVSRLGSC
jgi:hypothetical protein